MRPDPWYVKHWLPLLLAFLGIVGGRIYLLGFQDFFGNSRPRLTKAQIDDLKAAYAEEMATGKQQKAYYDANPNAKRGPIVHKLLYLMLSEGPAIPVHLNDAISAKNATLFGGKLADKCLLTNEKAPPPAGCPQPMTTTTDVADIIFAAPTKDTPKVEGDPAVGLANKYLLTCQPTSACISMSGEMSFSLQRSPAAAGSFVVGEFQSLFWREDAIAKAKPTPPAEVRIQKIYVMNRDGR